MAMHLIHAGGKECYHECSSVTVNKPFDFASNGYVCVSFDSKRSKRTSKRVKNAHNPRPFDRPTSTICIASQCHFSSLRKIQFYLPLFHIQTIVSLIVLVLFARFYAFSLYIFFLLSSCVFASLTLDEIEYNFHT